MHALFDQAGSFCFSQPSGFECFCVIGWIGHDLAPSVIVADRFNQNVRLEYPSPQPLVGTAT